MRKLLFSLTTLLFLAAGCSNDDFVDNGAVTPVAQKRTITYITASMEGADTRTQLVKGTHVVWDEYDAIWLFADQAGGDFADYQITSGVGTSTATFEGDALTGTTFYAVYPSFDGWEWREKSRLVIPWNYYDVVFGEDDCNHYIPMFAKESNGVLKFQQLGGALHFQVTGTGELLRATLRSNTEDQHFKELFELDFSGATPTLSEAYGDSEGGYEEMYGDAYMALSDTPLDIYFILPAGMTFKDGFTLTLDVLSDEDVQKSVVKSTDQEVTITRGQINGYPAFDFDELYAEQATETTGWTLTFDGTVVGKGGAGYFKLGTPGIMWFEGEDPEFKTPTTLSLHGDFGDPSTGFVTGNYHYGVLTFSDNAGYAYGQQTDEAVVRIEKDGGYDVVSIDFGYSRTDPVTGSVIEGDASFRWVGHLKEVQPTPVGNGSWSLWSGEEIWGSGVYATIVSTSDYMTKFAFFDKEDYGGSILATLSVFDLGLDDIPDGEPVWRSSWEFEFYKNKSYYTAYRVEGSASDVITLGRVGDVYGISFTFDTHVADTGETLGGGGFQWSGTLVNEATPMSVGEWTLGVTGGQHVSGDKYRVSADSESVWMECIIETPGFYSRPHEVWLSLEWATINSVAPGEAIETSEYKMDFWRGDSVCCLDGQTPMTLGISEDGAYYIIINDFTYTTWNDNGDEIEVEHGGSFTWTGDFGDNVEWSY